MIDGGRVLPASSKRKQSTGIIAMGPPLTSLPHGKGKRRRIASTTGLVLLGLYALFALELTTTHIGRRRTVIRESGKRRRLLRKHRKKNVDDLLSASNVANSERWSSRNDENAFIHQVELLLRNDTSSTAAFAIVVHNEGKVYCRQSQTKALSRARHFVQMLQHGFAARYQTEKLRNNLPIIIKHDDSSGCYPKAMLDKYSFPRLTWSVPAGNRSWCNAIGMPSYKVWREAKKGGGRDRKLLEMARNEIRYPWHSKISKAVWRGSTTYNRALFGNRPLTETPRAKLVRESLGARDLIDAGFHKNAGNSSTTNLDDGMFKPAMPLNEMMKYKGTLRYARLKKPSAKFATG